jgi:hypothetical protein
VLQTTVCSGRVRKSNSQEFYGIILGLKPIERWHLGQQHKAIECALSGDSVSEDVREIGAEGAFIVIGLDRKMQRLVNAITY